MLHEQLINKMNPKVVDYGLNLLNSLQRFGATLYYIDKVVGFIPADDFVETSTLIKNYKLREPTEQNII